MSQALLPFDAPPRQSQIASVAAERRGFDSARAESSILTYLADHTGTAEQIIAAIQTPDNEPHDERAYGKIFASLSRRGLIVKEGFAPRFTGNPCIVWRIQG